MPFAIVLIVLATAWRIVAAYFPMLVNFSPLMALAFCGAVYFSNKRLWLVPFAALTLSDLYLDHYYATNFNYEWTFGGALIRALCFAAGLGLGAMVARNRSWLNILSGALTGSVFFYLVTNTASFLGDATYVHTLAGWWQAMTVGHPEFPPTILFFRNTLVSDLVFTGVFAAAMEYAALHAGRPSLLTKRVSA
ncbi:MAG: DUF6580 family putative transport protein [Opitutaceae bacterium]